MGPFSSSPFLIGGETRKNTLEMPTGFPDSVKVLITGTLSHLKQGHLQMRFFSGPPLFYLPECSAQEPPRWHLVARRDD